MAYNKSKWKEQAIESQKKAHDLIHEIGKNYFRNPKQIAEMLEFNSRFYQYSLNNTKLIYSQNQNAVYVQSYEAWKKMDTHVKKGEKGIKIFVPVKVTLLNLDEGMEIPLSEASEEDKRLYKAGLIEFRSVLRFKIGNVFDISQTDYPPEKYPELFSIGYSSEQHELICKGLEDFCGHMGVSVSYEKVSSISLRGFYAPKTNRVVVNEILNDTQRLSTLSHEIGHMLEKHGERDISTAQKEFEADSISILIQSHFGMELTDARKDHLADHYREFKKELEKEHPDLSEEDQIKKIDEALSASMSVFRKHIEQIQEFVEQRIKSLSNSVSLNHEEAVACDQSQMAGGEITESRNAEIKRYTFTVNECNEFPEMGNIYAEIPTGLAAIELLKNIPDYKRNMIPGIELAIDSSKGSLYSMSIPLLVGNMVDLSMLEYYEPMQSDRKATKMVMDFVDQAKKAGCKIYGEFSPREQQVKRTVGAR